MPYIRQEDRPQYESEINSLVEKIDLGAIQDGIIDPGHFNYIFTTILNRCKFTRNYRNYNAIVGMVECVKSEYYRCEVAPYEDIKKEQNGTV